MEDKNQKKNPHIKFTLEEHEIPAADSSNFLFANICHTIIKPTKTDQLDLHEIGDLEINLP